MNPTAFVFGAGASMDYFYPSGWQIRKEIIQQSDPAFVRSTNLPQYKDIGFTMPQIEKFNLDLVEADTYSIDEFLQRLEQHWDLGKFLVAKVLLQILTSAGRHLSKIRCHSSNSL